MSFEAKLRLFRERSSLLIWGAILAYALSGSVPVEATDSPAPSSELPPNHQFTPEELPTPNLPTPTPSDPTNTPEIIIVPTHTTTPTETPMPSEFEVAFDMYNKIVETFNVYKVDNGAEVIKLLAYGSGFVENNPDLTRDQVPDYAAKYISEISSRDPNVDVEALMRMFVTASNSWEEWEGQPIQCLTAEQMAVDTKKSGAPPELVITGEINPVAIKLLEYSQDQEKYREEIGKIVDGSLFYVGSARPERFASVYEEYMHAGSAYLLIQEGEDYTGHVLFTPAEIIVNGEKLLFYMQANVHNKGRIDEFGWVNQTQFYKLLYDDLHAISVVGANPR